MKVSPMETPIPHLTPSAHQRHHRGITMSLASNTLQDRPATMTESALDTLESVARSLSDTVDEHESRIGMCLRSQPPQNDTKGSPTAVQDSTLLARLDTLYSLLVSTRTRLEEITSRVTL